MLGGGPLSIAWTRVLRIAGRLAVCLALSLLPLAQANASHHERGIAATHAPEGHGDAPEGHGETPAPGDQADHAPICHHLGTCHAFVAPPVPPLAHERPALTIAPAAAVPPPQAAAHRMFRPPRSAVRA